MLRVPLMARRDQRVIGRPQEIEASLSTARKAVSDRAGFKSVERTQNWVSLSITKTSHEKMKTIIITMCSLSLLASGTLTVNAKDAKGQEEYKIGQPFTLGDYTYNVTKFEAKRKIGSQYYNKEAEEGAKFIVVYYSIRNNTKETQTVRSEDFKVL
jgi:hypothetical protein